MEDRAMNAFTDWFIPALLGGTFTAIGALKL
jgi:hypothetical protein